MNKGSASWHNQEFIGKCIVLEVITGQVYLHEQYWSVFLLMDICGRYTEHYYC